ncbi:MAG: hypothetical protein M3N98_12475, partial [Actinomycetota bacterium]|nr:hypothetical protein [Actinomycetota bacterium]
AMAAVAIAISLIVAVMLVVASGHGHRPKVTVAATGSGPGVVASTTTPPDTITITTGPGSSTSAGPSTTGLPTTTMLQPGHFVVGATKLDFGTTVPSLSLVVSNDGAGGLSFTASSPSSQVAVSPGSGTIDPSSSKTLTVTLDRNSAPPGPFSSTVAITSPTGTAIVAIAAVVDPGPTVSGELAVPAEIRQANGALCLVPTANASSVTARITAPVTINPGQVVLHWQSTPATGSRPMSFNGSTATATLGPFSTTGLVDWWITATDAAGISGSSAHHQVTVSCRVV